MKSGLYICKTYWKIGDKLVPILKYGKTRNIDTRMMHYNKRNVYKLLAFFPCFAIDEREHYVHSNGYFKEEFRLHKTEHIKYESGIFKLMYGELLYASKIRVIKKKTKKGAFVLTYLDA